MHASEQTSEPAVSLQVPLLPNIWLQMQTFQVLAAL